MKRLIITLCLTVSLAFGSFGVGLSGNLQKGLQDYQKGDYAAAFKEWIPLAEEGDKEAQYFIGFMYEYGNGIPGDYKMAMKWYTLSAEQGYSNAQTNLAVMYALGDGVNKDRVYAHMWANIAYSNGNKGGKNLKDKLIKMMIPSQIEEAERLARECIKKNYKGC